MSTCSPRQGRIQKIFLYSNHSPWSPTFQGTRIWAGPSTFTSSQKQFPESHSGLQEHPLSIKGSPAPTARGCKCPELSCRQAGAGAGSHCSPQPGSQTGATFSKTRGRSEVFVPQEGELQPGLCFSHHQSRGRRLLQTPPHCHYRGLDRKLRVSQGAAPSERLTQLCRLTQSRDTRARL